MSLGESAKEEGMNAVPCLATDVFAKKPLLETIRCVNVATPSESMQ